jgi:ABC-2 type transport system permease protein
MSMIVSVPIVLTALRINGEENRGRLEQIFSKAVPRAKLYGSFIVVAILESICIELLLIAGLCATSGGELTFGSLLGVGLSYLPAIWAMTGIAVLLVGFLPKLTAINWAMFGYTFFVMYFGRVMDVPEWAQRITPFGNIPQLPVQEFTATPLIILTLISAAFIAIGVWRYKQRDIG